MKVNQNIIVSDIKNKKFRNIYLLYGEESYLKRYYKNNLISHLVNKGDNINLTYFNKYNFSIDEVISLANTMPLFSNYRVIVLENIDMDSSQSEKFLDYFNHINESTIIIYIKDNMNKNTKLYKIIDKLNGIVECSLPKNKNLKEDILKQWIYKKLSKFNKKIKNDAWGEFYTRSSISMDEMNNELEKLISYVGDREEITLSDIKTICVNRMENKLFDMIDAIGYKDYKKAMDYYKTLLMEDIYPLEILNALRTQFIKIKMVNSMINDNYDKYTISDKTHIYKTYIDKTINIAKNFSGDEITLFLDKILSYDEKIKNGTINPYIALENIILYSK